MQQYRIIFFRLLAISTVFIVLCGVYYFAYVAHVDVAPVATVKCQISLDGHVVTAGTSSKVRPGDHTITISGSRVKKSSKSVSLDAFSHTSADCPTMALSDNDIFRELFPGINDQDIYSNKLLENDTWLVAYANTHRADGAIQQVVGKFTSGSEWQRLGQSTGVDLSGFPDVPVSVQVYVENEASNE